MTDNNIPLKPIPDWFLEIVAVMQDVDHGLRNIETEVRYATRLDNLDPRLLSDMRHLAAALSAVKSSLSTMDTTARQLLKEIAKCDEADLANANV